MTPEGLHTALVAKSRSAGVDLEDAIVAHDAPSGNCNVAAAPSRAAASSGSPPTT